MLRAVIAVFDERGRGLILRGARAQTETKGRHPYLTARDAAAYYGTYPGLRGPRPLLLVPHENTEARSSLWRRMFLRLQRSIGPRHSSIKSFPHRSRRRGRLGVFSNTSSSEQRCPRISGSTREPVKSRARGRPRQRRGDAHALRSASGQVLALQSPPHVSQFLNSVARLEFHIE
jgi:hypothetical protein